MFSLRQARAQNRSGVLQDAPLRFLRTIYSYFNVAQVVSFLKVLLHKELVYYAITAHPSLKLSLKSEVISKDLLHYSLPSLHMGRCLDSITWFLHKVRGLINH